MLQYLIILLDNSSTSYCHYKVRNKNQRLIDLDNLKAGIRFAMKQNLMIQFVYPESDIPQEYKQVIETIDHSKIIPSTSPLAQGADVVVFNDWKELVDNTSDYPSPCVLRISKEELFAQRYITTMVDFIKRKNFSKPIDKFRIICYYVILRIYLFGFPWYDYIITQFYVFVNTFNTYFCVSMFLTIVRMCFCGFL